jgi:hypothetical protein
MADSGWLVESLGAADQPYAIGHRLDAQVAQSVEHVLGKDEVSGSIPLLGFCPGHKMREQVSKVLRNGER